MKASFEKQRVGRQRQRLIERGKGRRNEVFLASMLASWQAGKGEMPDWLGMNPSRYHSCFRYHFHHAPVHRARLGRPVDPERGLEWDDLRGFLLGFRAYRCASEVWVAELISTGCMGSNHLWQDLGLSTRQELSDMIALNFPRLAAKNSMNMKWKKFIYRELCKTEGIYVCRSPSCDVCVDYDNCYGPED